MQRSRPHLGVGMRILVGWDSPDELETIQSFLNIGDNSAVVVSEAAAFSAAFERDKFDVVLQAWTVDAAAPHGLSASHALVAHAP